MNDTFGLSFAPLAANTQGQTQGTQGATPGQAPVQDAIKLLSLRIPKFAGGAGGVAPNALLTGPGAAGAPSAGLPAPGQLAAPGAGTATLDELLRRLLGIGIVGPNAGLQQPNAAAPPSGPSGWGTEPVSTPQRYTPLPMGPSPTIPLPHITPGLDSPGQALGNTTMAPVMPESAPPPPPFDPIAAQFNLTGYGAEPR